MSNDGYLIVGALFGAITALIAFVASVIYAVSAYGWFLGVPLGFLIGAFFAALGGFIAVIGWPLICLVLLWAAFHFMGWA